MSETDFVQPRAGVPETDVREQVAKILSSRLFQRSDRLSRFLRYVAEECLSGRAAELKEQVLAAELYARGDDFDPAADPIVRVDARRLRDKLREYYAESPSEPVLITLPKGSYAPLFERNPSVARRVEAIPSAIVATEPQRRPPRVWWWALATAVIAISGAIGVVSRLPAPETPPVRLTPLTSYPGSENGPALSPDGNFVAFSRTPPGPPGPPDIYVKAADNEAFHRITETPVGEYSPAWSPDGKQIAFVRGLRSRELGVFVIARLGGAEKRIADTGTHVDWTPDGQSLIIRVRTENEPYSLFRVDLRTLQRRQLTRPPAGFVDWWFDVSPDGKRLVFVRLDHAGVGSIYTVGMDGGEATRLTDSRAGMRDIGWMPNGRELIYAAPDEGIQRLWRFPADRSRVALPIPHIPMSAGEFSISRPGPREGMRLAFVTTRSSMRIHRIDLQSAVSGAFSAGTPFSETTRRDWPLAFSPDGTHVVFASNRATPNPELWIADNVGNAARQLTSLRATRIGGCTWSPDGKRIAFGAVVNNSSDLYVVGLDGSKPAQLTTSPAVEDFPEWSRDGHWIYYTASAEGHVPDVWRIPAEGGSGQPVTRNGGLEPKEALDGRYLYYVDRPPDIAGGSQVGSRLMRIPVDGGNAEVIHDRVPPFYWSITDKGIIFLNLAELTPAKQKARQLKLIRVDAVEMYQFSDRKIVRLGTLPFRVDRFVVSRDGRWALAGINAVESDLMLLDGLR